MALFSGIDRDLDTARYVEDGGGVRNIRSNNIGYLRRLRGVVFFPGFTINQVVIFRKPSVHMLLPLPTFVPFFRIPDIILIACSKECERDI